MTFLHREDLKTAGFETDGVSDAVMAKLPIRMGQMYVATAYWADLDTIAETLGIPRAPSPAEDRPQLPA